MFVSHFRFGPFLRFAFVFCLFLFCCAICEIIVGFFHVSFRAWTNLLMSWYVETMAGLSKSLNSLHLSKDFSQSMPSCPSLAARIYLKKRKMSGLSEVGLRSSLSSLKNCKKLITSILHQFIKTQLKTKMLNFPAYCQYWYAFHFTIH